MPTTRCKGHGSGRKAAKGNATAVPGHTMYQQLGYYCQVHPKESRITQGKKIFVKSVSKRQLMNQRQLKYNLCNYQRPFHGCIQHRVCPRAPACLLFVCLSMCSERPKDKQPWVSPSEIPFTSFETRAHIDLEFSNQARVSPRDPPVSTSQDFDYMGMTSSFTFLSGFWGSASGPQAYKARS